MDTLTANLWLMQPPWIWPFTQNVSNRTFQKYSAHEKKIPFIEVKLTNFSSTTNLCRFLKWMIHYKPYADLCNLPDVVHGLWEHDHRGKKELTEKRLSWGRQQKSTMQGALKWSWSHTRIDAAKTVERNQPTRTLHPSLPSPGTSPIPRYSLVFRTP